MQVGLFFVENILMLIECWPINEVLALESSC